MAQIHPTAIVSDGAEVAESVIIGPYSYIGPNVKIDENCVLQNHVVIEGHTIVGKNNNFYHHATIGSAPQDLSYRDEPTEVHIADNNIFREFVTIHRGTMKDNRKTIVGSHCMLMAFVHVGHDVVMGDYCVIANSTNFAGHVKCGDRVTIGGGSQVSQFCSLGRGAYIGGATAIDRDIPLFCTAYGNRAKLKGINIIGLRRQGYSKEDVSEIVDFYRTMEASAFSPRAFVKDQNHMKEFTGNKIIDEMAKTIIESEIGISPFVS
jgi:UDP-N-acetylglucosamine acyltransferase